MFLHILPVLRCLIGFTFDFYFLLFFRLLYYTNLLINRKLRKNHAVKNDDEPVLFAKFPTLHYRGRKLTPFWSEIVSLRRVLTRLILL